MKTNFIKQKAQNKAKKDKRRRAKALAIVLFCLIIFWTISSILGLVAFFRPYFDNYTKSVYAAEVKYSVYRDSLEPDDSINFLYKNYEFTGLPNGNFASPFKITINTDLPTKMTIYMRFNQNDYTNPNGFQLFYNGLTQKTPAFTRLLLDNITYYKVEIPVNLMRTIISSYNSQVSLMTLSYDFDSPQFFDFDLFVVRGTGQIYSPAYFEGFLSSSNYEQGYADGLKSTDYSEFFNGSGVFTYSLNSTLYSKEFVPSALSTYFSNGVFLFSKYVLDTIGDNFVDFSGGNLQFHFARKLTISSSYFLETSAFGTFSSGQNLGLTFRYYNFSVDTGQRIYAESRPSVNIIGGFLGVDENFWTINNTITRDEDGNPVNNYGPVEVDTLILGINSSYFLDVLETNNNTINLGFPTGFFNGYQAGIIDGQLSFDSQSFYQAGYQAGKEYASGEYWKGYQKGLDDNGGYQFLGLFGAIIDAPIQALTGLLDFEIFGFNLLTLFMGLITVSLVVFVIRLFI